MRNAGSLFFYVYPWNDYDYTSIEFVTVFALITVLKIISSYLI